MAYTRAIFDPLIQYTSKDNLSCCLCGLFSVLVHDLLFVVIGEQRVTGPGFVLYADLSRWSYNRLQPVRTESLFLLPRCKVVLRTWQLAAEKVSAAATEPYIL